jgi:hypothetical protein
MRDGSQTSIDLSFPPFPFLFFITAQASARTTFPSHTHQTWTDWVSMSFFVSVEHAEHDAIFFKFPSAEQGLIFDRAYVQYGN